MPRLLPVLALLVPGLANAACVVIDPERDNLNADDQRAATVLLEDLLREHGETVTPPPCDDPWELTHTRLGAATTVRLVHGKHSDKLSVERIEELPKAYDRLVRAAKNGTSAGTNANRDTVTREEQEPTRVQAESLATLRVGWGVLPTSGDTGPALGGGTRFELDRLGIDLAFDAVIPTESPFIAVQGRIGALLFASPVASSTPYLGVGLGIGALASDEGGFFGGTGTASIGYAFLRETSIRLNPQVDLVMPLDTAGNGNWTPWGTLTMGIAYEPFRARRGR